MQDKIISKIKDYKDKVSKLTPNSNKEEVTREKFTFLLSGISSCRKMPGIPNHKGFDELGKCETESDKNETREFLKKVFGITDIKSLFSACNNNFFGDRQYEQFLTFWNNAPLFDIKMLNPEGLKAFTAAKDFAEKLYPIVEEKGFYAWDINERIGLCRSANACGIISDEEFFQLTDGLVRTALVFYNSFEEYAISCLCGAIYEMSAQKIDLEGFYNINAMVIDSLLEEGGAWNRYAWYKPESREWATMVGQNKACIVSNKVLEEERVGYVYRDDFDPEGQDSGWRMFTGDEPQEYIDDPSNSTVVSINKPLNFNPKLLGIIYAEAGKKFGYDGKKWVEE